MARANFGIFDIDTRQARNSGGWTYVGRTAPYRDKIDRLIGAATSNHVPLVVTSCVGANMLPKDAFEKNFKDTLFVPMDSDDTAWSSQCDSYNIFYIEKKARRPDFSYDGPFPPHQMFLNSENANRLIQKLDIDEWIVIGNAMEACGDLVIVKLLEHSRRVRYIPELMIPGIRCQNCDPVEFKANVFASWDKIHAEPMALEDAYRYVEGSHGDAKAVA